MSSKKVAILSGGSRGLGESIVSRFLDNGYAVATFSRSKTPFIEKCLAEHSDNGDTFHWECMDANSSDQMRKYVRTVNSKFGRVDALINNAGANLDQVLPSTSDDQVEDILSLNTKSVILLTKSVSKAMLINGSGAIVNISSIIGKRGFKGTSVYAASKSAIDGFSRALARELGPKNIRVNSISPGFIETDMTEHMPKAQRAQILRRTPLGRFGSAHEIASLAIFLSSVDASYITGQSFTVDGGLTC